MDHTDALWKASHSYKISVSDLYYCDGSCVENGSRGLSGLEMEEDQAEETGLAETDTVSEETTTGVHRLYQMEKEELTYLILLIMVQ